MEWIQDFYIYNCYDFYEFDKGRMANLLNGVVVNAQRVFKKKKKRKPHVSIIDCVVDA